MRKFLAAALAVPVVALVVAGSMLRGDGHRRRIMAITASLVVLVVGVSAITVRPAPAAGTTPSAVSALDPSEFTTEIATGESPVAPITVTFPVPMNPASVEALLRVDPTTSVALSWDATGTLLTITPTETWASGLLHTVTVESGALDATGKPLARRVRAAFLTRPPTTATIVPTAGVAADAWLATAFRLTFSGPIDDSTLDLLVSPAVDGALQPVPSAAPGTPAFDFVPADPLDPNTDYQLSLSPGTRDLDGAPIEAAAVTIHTASAPSVIRFRPRTGTADVALSQTLSVRFTEPMDHATTEAAWSATQGGKPIVGSFKWAENDTVLVFDPKAAFGYSQALAMSVAATAMSRAGLPLEATATATFKTVARPSAPSTGGGSGASGGSLGAGTWAAVESYVLTLMNCTRTGGWVTSTGACSSPGGRDVAPLWIDAGISSKVSRPYARLLVLDNVCSHYYKGTPADRLRRAGYASYNWAENLQCQGGNPMAAALSTHLFFQSEKSYNGGHYVNMMNARYDRVGIGAWASGSRLRIVIDFYHP